MRAPDWLTARPVAHRGLHDRARGVVENMPQAFKAAIAGNFAIELDVQVTADGEAMVHHDDALGRLNEGTARLTALTAAQLRHVAFKDTADRMIALGELCDMVAGRVTLVVEIKSHYDSDRRLVTRVADVLKSYSGPAVAMSFDPEQVLMLKELAPTVVRGIVAQRTYSDDYWTKTSAARRRTMTTLRHGFWSQPQFVAYFVDDLPAPPPWIARNLFRCPLLTWTVRTTEQRERARQHADQMIFEGFVPEN
jgi:glycerophosphoryl diester phosphodiesterase